ncbi:MAG: ArsR/SmtB family transcription factor [Actinomycetota bacterium]
MASDRCDLLCLDLEVAEGLRRALPSRSMLEDSSERMRALGDPTRLLVAIALARAGELCVCDLAWVTERTSNLVSHHLRILRSAGLVSSRRDRKMVLYALTEEGLSFLESLGEVNVEDGAAL